MLHRSLVCCVLVLSIFAGCRDTGVSIALDSGIDGQVYSIGSPGPIPVGWIPPPLETVSSIVVLDAAHRQMKEFATDGKGHFRTSLSPGTYFLRVKESLIPAETGPFDVTAGKVLSVAAYYDNGMR